MIYEITVWFLVMIYRDNCVVSTNDLQNNCLVSTDDLQNNCVVSTND